MVELAQSVQELGLAGIIVLIAIVAVIGAARGWYVFGWLYRQEREARITAETQATRNAESIAKSSEAYVELSKAYTDMSKAYGDLRRSVVAERGSRRRTETVDGSG